MKRLYKWYSGLNIFYQLLPFLVLYIAICILIRKNELNGDEGRYLEFAGNLLKGFYSPPYPDINLWNGPGYPALLATFMFFKLPLLGLRLLNPFLLYFALIINYKTFSIYCSKKSAYIFTILIGLYFPVYEMLSEILTETLTWFLISLICFLLLNAFKKQNISWKLIILSGFSIAYLAMTKVIFGYAIIFMLFVSVVMFLMPKFRSTAKRSVLIFLISFIFCLPWLFYTYNLTNKPFYWGNSGNMSLYTMSTPYENELGDWESERELQENPNHQIFMDSILKLAPLERDEAYKKAAIKNIKGHSKKFFSNWVANIGRLLFSYPYSNKEQNVKSYFTIIPNMFVVVIIVLIFPLSIVYYKRIPQGLIFLLLFILIYLFGSTLLGAYRRMFYVTMPFWFFYISYVFNNIISVKIKPG